MVFLFCCVEKWNESATSEEEQVESMYRQEGRTAKLALRSKVLTMHPEDNGAAACLPFAKQML